MFYCFTKKMSDFCFIFYPSKWDRSLFLFDTLGLLFVSHKVVSQADFAPNFSSFLSGQRKLDG